jgi:hypothetical protein
MRFESVTIERSFREPRVNRLTAHSKVSGGGGWCEAVELVDVRSLASSWHGEDGKPLDTLCLAI